MLKKNEAELERSMLQCLKEWLGQTTWVAILTVTLVCPSLLSEMRIVIVPTSEFFRRRQWHPTPVLLPGKSHGRRSLVGWSPWGHEELDTTERLHFHFHFHAMEKEMATHSSVLAWRIPGMGEPGGLPSMGSHRAGHDWGNLAVSAAAAAEMWQTIKES